MTGILFVDDGQVVQITAGKVYGAPERVDIMVEAL
jgi:Holliday junction resolvase RusA-like endonuclease